MKKLATPTARLSLTPVLGLVLGLVLGPVLGLGGCSSKQVVTEPDPGPAYGRPLPAGASALRKVTDPERLPDLEEAFRNGDTLLIAACDESIRWFDAPSSRTHFPLEDVTHERARASVLAMRSLLEESASPSAFRRDVEHMFDVYESVGWNDEGVVLFTGYYAPIFAASRTPTEAFRYPLYMRPDDLVTDPATGAPHGRRTADGSVVPYYTRAEIENQKLLAGTELVWLEDALSAFIVHVNGSAKLRMQDDGSVMYIGYAGKTDREYASVGKAIIREGLISENDMTLSAIRRLYRRQPDVVETLMKENENYVFFQEYPGDNWPAGSLGVQVTSESSLATDKKIYPRGGVVMVDTMAETFADGKKPFRRFMLDQDTGGAIQAPGRADIFMGVGPGAEILAGGQHAEGRLFYFFLKPEFVEQTLVYYTREDRYPVR